MDIKKTNASLVRTIFSGDTDLLKQAIDQSTYFIRDRVRELGIARKIFEPIFVTAADLDRIANSDEPAIILSKDMDATAYTLPFRGQGESKYWDGEDFIITFHKYSSDKFNKSKFEMMNSKVKYDKLLEKRIVEAMFQVEDETVMNAVKAVIAKAEVERPGTQYLATGEGLTKSSIKVLIQMMSKLRMIPTDPKSDKDRPKFLMTTTLKQELIELGLMDIGDAGVSKHFNNGVAGITRLMGFPIITTIKDDIVANDEVYMFAPEDYSGRFMILQDHTLVIETKADLISFFSYAAMGFGIANTKSVAKIKLDLS
jgi:hypothetical protein